MGDQGQARIQQMMKWCDTSRGSERVTRRKMRFTLEEKGEEASGEPEPFATFVHGRQKQLTQFII